MSEERTEDTIEQEGTPDPPIEAIQEDDDDDLLLLEEDDGEDKPSDQALEERMKKIEKRLTDSQSFIGKLQQENAQMRKAIQAPPPAQHPQQLQAPPPAQYPQQTLSQVEEQVFYMMKRDTKEAFANFFKKNDGINGDEDKVNRLGTALSRLGVDFTNATPAMVANLPETLEAAYRMEFADEIANAKVKDKIKKIKERKGLSMKENTEHIGAGSSPPSATQQRNSGGEVFDNGSYRPLERMTNRDAGNKFRELLGG